MGRPVVIAGIAIHNRFPAADEFQDITSKSKPTPENPITLYVSLTQRDGRIARVGTLAMAVGGMSSKCQSSGRLTNSHPRYLAYGNHSHQPNRGHFTDVVSLTAGGVRLATGQQSTLTVCRQTVEVVREAPEKPASRTSAPTERPY
jgi:hypothetical protein